MAAPVFIHVGFCSTGTTSLQQNFFANRSDIFFAGEPYGERGGIFTAIKSSEEFKYDPRHLEVMRDDFIFKKNGDRPIVVSDETLCDTPLLYLGPYMMPRDVIAFRLHHLFPSAKIIFTIRDQRQYALSAYMTLRRNTAFFDGMPMPPFSTWLDAMLSRKRSHFLQNLNFMEAIEVYAKIFGRENICVLPLEMLTTDGPNTYLGRLCEFIGLKLTDADIANYSPIRNQRMSARRELVAELLEDNRFSRFYVDLSNHFGEERMASFLDRGARATIELSTTDANKISNCVGLGNWLLDQRFGLDLGRYGYMSASDGTFTKRELLEAHRHSAFLKDTDRLRGEPQETAAAELQGDVEITRLQQLVMELLTVSRSPVWRIVNRLDRIRRAFSRAVTLIARPLPIRFEATAVWCTVKDRRFPWWPRLLSMVLATYLLGSTDLIPDKIPVLGWLDEAAIALGSVWLAAVMIPRLLRTKRRALNRLITRTRTDGARFGQELHTP